jgi:AcrR family transcriptional regulator
MIVTMATQTSGGKRPTRRKPKQPSATDPTRAKLMVAAAEVFAEVGFQAATVREISKRAGVNIAAVNYHFRDKLGLYTEVFEAAVRPVGKTLARAVFDPDMTPEQALRAAIKVWLFRLYGTGRPALPFRLMRHELIQPTPALARVVDEVIRPNFNRLRTIIAAMLSISPDDDKAKLCTASIMGQALLYPQAAPVLALLWPQLKITPEQLEKIADHIADFSLAYLHSQRVKS